MTVIKSTFNAGANGWTFVGDTASTGWVAQGGHPGGYLGWTDAATGDIVYYKASQAYHGDLGEFYKGKLSYDVIDNAGGLASLADVKITGANGVTLVAEVGQAGTDWTRLSIAFKPGAGWKVGTLDGDDATARDIKGVLHDVVDFQIRAEYHTGDESGGLDNVVLRSRPVAPVDANAFGPDSHVLLPLFHVDYLTHGAAVMQV